MSERLFKEIVWKCVASGAFQTGSVNRPAVSSSRGDIAFIALIENSLKNRLSIFPCMSAAIACKDFLQTSGKCPSSLRIPPFCPPIPSAHVLQAFFERIAFQSFQNPTRLPMLNEYFSAWKPPPASGFFMDVSLRKMLLPFPRGG